LGQRIATKLQHEGSKTVKVCPEKCLYHAGTDRRAGLEIQSGLTRVRVQLSPSALFEPISASLSNKKASEKSILGKDRLHFVISRFFFSSHSRFVLTADLPENRGNAVKNADFLPHIHSAKPLIRALTHLRNYEIHSFP